MSVPYALDYAQIDRVIAHTPHFRTLAQDNKDQLFADVRVMEQAAIKHFNEQLTKKAKK